MCLVLAQSLLLHFNPPYPLSFESDAGQRCYDCCCQAVELSPSNPEAHQVMANCLLSQQLPEKAKEALMKGVLLWLPSRQKKEGQEAAAVGGASETDLEVFKLLIIQFLKSQFCVLFHNRVQTFLHIQQE